MKKKNDQNLARIYQIIESLSNQVNDYVQNINISQPYNISYFERLIRLVVLEIQNLTPPPKKTKLSLSEALSFYQCYRKIPDFESTHLNFLKNNSTNTN